MRRIAGLAVATALLTGAAGLGIAAADEPTPEVPSKGDVRAAEDAVDAAAGSVAEVRARLAVAAARQEAAEVAAARAAEEFNGARWRAAQARQAVADTSAAATTAAADQETLRQGYADLMVTTSQDSPELRALAAITQADGLGSLLETRSALRSGQAALDERYDELKAATALAATAAEQAAAAQADADRAAEEARDARDAAGVAADRATSETAAVAAERDRLIADLARLQDVSVDIAARRQAGLEARARAQAAAAAQAAAEQAAADQAAADQAAADQAAADQAATEQAAAEQAAADQAAADQAAEPTEEPAEEPTEQPTEEPIEEPADPTPPAPATGAAAAIAFARDQLGEPYRWAAAGPSAWDCSGLTAGAWAAGGKSLPHYSVAQYEQSTPIRAADLKPGDLLFWGSSSSPSSIYHVALYVGDGMMIHAPRTGRPVTEESMYYWIAPTFYARP